MPTAGALRPAVRCQTNKYNMRMRAGRGFTLAELKVRDSFPGSTLFAHLAPPLSFFCPVLCVWAGGEGGGLEKHHWQTDYVLLLCKEVRFRLSCCWWRALG